MTSTTVQLTQRQRDRLTSEQVIWLTTVKASGTPVPTPVWFLWSADEFLIFSEPDTAKLANIATNPRVALNFNSTSGGGDVAVFTARAAVDGSGPTAVEWEAYVAKYGDSMRGMDISPEDFKSSYSVLIRAAVERVRGW